MNYDRIIIELLDRVSSLEKEVASLKAQAAPATAPESSTPGRDKTKYMLDGVRYGKNRLVLAIVKTYVQANPGITANSLLATFDKSLQGSLGVVRTLDDVKSGYKNDYKQRFFCQPDEIVKTATEDCVVCTQWGVANIGNILARAKELGINVSVI